MQRGRGRRWERFRLEILERDGYTCQACGLDMRWLHELCEVDHKVPVYKAPRLQYDPNNCQTLCRDCHHKKSLQEQGLLPGQIEWHELVRGMIR